MYKFLSLLTLETRGCGVFRGSREKLKSSFEIIKRDNNEGLSFG